MAAENLFKFVVIGAYLIFIMPFVASILTVYYAVVLLRKYALGLASGFGVGKDSDTAPVTAPPSKPGGKREPAYNHYLFGQAWKDVRQVSRLASTNLSQRTKVSWTKVWEDYFGGVTREWWRRPFGVTLALGLFFGVLLTGIVLIVVIISQAFVLGLSAGLGFAAIYLFRGVDTVFLQVRGITMTCQHCGRRITLPEYNCPGCKKARHKDLRPGRYGMTHRRCACGKRFPTLSLLGNHKLEAFCPIPACGKPLAAGIGGAAEIILPFFGATRAGKTQLLITFVTAVEVMADRDGGKAEPADENTKNWLPKARAELATGKIRSTARGMQPAYSLRVQPGNGRAKFLRAFDAAGEMFTKSHDIEALRYLKLAKTFVFVVDPLSIDELWQELDSQVQDQLSREKKRAVREPRLVFEETVQAIAAMGVQTEKARLVVVVSKADLIEKELREAQVDVDESIKKWLAEGLRQENMVRAMDQAFGGVRYFLTSAILDTRNRNEADRSIEIFAEMILADEGLRL